MSIGVGGILGASLMLGLLATTAVVAQTPANGSWIDPPARGAAPTPPPPAAASPTAPVQEQTAAKSGTGKSAETKSAEKRAADRTAAEDSAARRKAERPKPSVVRQARAPERQRIRQAERPRPVVAAAAPRVRAAPRFVEQRDYTARPAPRRVVARSFATRMVAAQPYRYAPLPVGRVDDFGDGERNPIFAEGDDRTRRIAAAQAAGYLVVRARSVQFPDGRMVRSYRPYDDDDGSD